MSIPVKLNTYLSDDNALSMAIVFDNLSVSEDGTNQFLIGAEDPGGGWDFGFG